MARRAHTIAILVVAALALPASAQARTPCPDERSVPSSQTAAAVGAAITCLSNQVRGHFALPPLRADARLDAASALHSLDMAVNDFFSHTGLNGSTPSQRAAAQGYAIGIGENIAFGYADARTVVVAWMASRGHCANLLSGAVDGGAGVAVATRPYYTQALGDYFSRPVDPAPAAGCPYTLDLDAISDPAVLAGPPPPATQLRLPAPPVAVALPATLAGLSLSRTRFRARGPRRGRGAVVRFRLSAAAAVGLRVQQRRGGRRAGGRCVAARRAGRRAPRCLRYVTLRGALAVDGRAGDNSTYFSGRWRGEALRAGRYKLLAAVAGAADAQRVRFVVRRP